MDSRGAGPGIAPAAGALHELPGAPEVVADVLAARGETARRLDDVRERVQRLTTPNGTSLVLFGSWGRAELTDESDVDWALIVEDSAADLESPEITETLSALRELLEGEGSPPGRQAIFGVPFHGERLVEHIGLADDDSANLTRRMLLLLESVAVTDPDIHAELKRRVLERYLSRHSRAHRPPRFLLNDVVRYWRTIAVDFEGKLAEDRRAGRGADKFVTRNAKLRTSRKMLYYSGLLPLLLCHYVAAEQIEPLLSEQFDNLATDRVARAFLHLGMPDAGARTLAAYSDWIGLMAVSDNREHLERLTDATRHGDELFERIRRIGDAIENAVLGLLYETELRPVAQRFLTS